MRWRWWGVATNASSATGNVCTVHLVLHLRRDHAQVCGFHRWVLGHLEEQLAAVVVANAERLELDAVDVGRERAAVACASEAEWQASGGLFLAESTEPR